MKAQERWQSVLSAAGEGGYVGRGIESRLGNALSMLWAALGEYDSAAALIATAMKSEAPAEELARQVLAAFDRFQDFEMDDFSKAYVECALWSSTDNSNERGGDPLDENYDSDDLTVATAVRLMGDCASFQKQNAELLEKCGLSSDRAGHDFWLTRNGHGAGFWDENGSTPEARSALMALSEASHAEGPFYLIVTDDGEISGTEDDALFDALAEVTLLSTKPVPRHRLSL